MSEVVITFESPIRVSDEDMGTIQRSILRMLRKEREDAARDAGHAAIHASLLRGCTRVDAHAIGLAVRADVLSRSEQMDIDPDDAARMSISRNEAKSVVSALRSFAALHEIGPAQSALLVRLVAWLYPVKDSQ